MTIVPGYPGAFLELFPKKSVWELMIMRQAERCLQELHARLVDKMILTVENKLKLRESYARQLDKVILTKHYRDNPCRQSHKIKTGIQGLVNGLKTTALPDTGSACNIVSAAFAQRHRLHIRREQHSFRLGNAKRVRSSGVVDLQWSFAEDPFKETRLVCYVLPRCSYDIILGRQFLIDSETYTKNKHRLNKCLDSPSKFLQFNLLNDSQQYVNGNLGSQDDLFATRAILDTGAECNVMSLGYAKRHGLKVQSCPQNQNFLQFADSSYEETVGQVDTYWTFTDGQRIAITFEILKHCSSDVILGEDIVHNHDVFNVFASSITTTQLKTDSWELAPFAFVTPWQQSIEKITSKTRVLKSKRTGDGRKPQEVLEIEERHRRDAWNFRNNYGSSASADEQAMEDERRRKYDATSASLSRRPLLIPSISTAHSPNDSH